MVVIFIKLRPCSSSIVPPRGHIRGVFLRERCDSYLPLSPSGTFCSELSLSGSSSFFNKSCFLQNISTIKLHTTTRSRGGWGDRNILKHCGGEVRSLAYILDPKATKRCINLHAIAKACAAVTHGLKRGIRVLLPRLFIKLLFLVFQLWLPAEIQQEGSRRWEPTPPY